MEPIHASPSTSGDSEHDIDEAAIAVAPAGLVALAPAALRRRAGPGLDQRVNGRALGDQLVQRIANQLAKGAVGKQQPSIQVACAQADQGRLFQ
jgi:hypothetical protein